MTGVIKARTRAYLMRRDRATCRYCYGPGDTIDHVIPWSVHRDNRYANLVVACLPCNEAAADLVFASLEGKQDHILAARGLPPAPYRLHQVPGDERPKASGVMLGERFPQLGDLLDQLA